MWRIILTLVVLVVKKKKEIILPIDSPVIGGSAGTALLPRAGRAGIRNRSNPSRCRSDVCVSAVVSRVEHACIPSAVLTFKRAESYDGF